MNEICDMFDSSENGKEIMQIVQANHASEFSTNGQSREQKRMPYKAKWWTQLNVVLWRSFMCIIKNPQLALVKLISTLVNKSNSIL